MDTMASQITSLTIVCAAVSSRRGSKKTSNLRITGLCVGIHRSPVNSQHKGPGTRKMFPFDDVIMLAVLSAVWLIDPHFDWGLWTNWSADWSQTWWIHSDHAPTLAPLNFLHSFLTSDWWSGFRAFADTAVIGFGWNLVGQLSLWASLAQPDNNFWSCFAE